MAERHFAMMTRAIRSTKAMIDGAMPTPATLCCLPCTLPPMPPPLATTARFTAICLAAIVGFDLLKKVSAGA